MLPTYLAQLHHGHLNAEFHIFVYLYNYKCIQIESRSIIGCMQNMLTNN